MERNGRCSPKAAASRLAAVLLGAASLAGIGAAGAADSARPIGAPAAVDPAAGEAIGAAAVIGYVKTVRGEAWRGPDGAPVPLVVGSPVRTGDTMRTGAGAWLGIVLHDNTVMSFGSGSVARIDDFLYEPTAREGRLSAVLLRGTASVISGLIAKLRPDAQTMRTPTATLGIRGTHFLVKVDESAP